MLINTNTLNNTSVSLVFTLRYLFCILDNVSGPADIASNKASTGFPLLKNKSAAVDKFPIKSDLYIMDCRSVIVTK